jgi:hypothetical protein
MDIYWLTLIATIYLIAFFIPLLLQLIVEKINKKEKFPKIKNIMKVKFLKDVIMFYKKENVIRSLSNSCFVMGILSIILSNITMLIFANNVSNQIFSMFIGLWAPTLICIGVFIRK